MILREDASIETWLKFIVIPQTLSKTLSSVLDVGGVRHDDMGSSYTLTYDYRYYLEFRWSLTHCLNPFLAWLLYAGQNGSNMRYSKSGLSPRFWPIAVYGTTMWDSECLRPSFAGLTLKITGDPRVNKCLPPALCLCPIRVINCWVGHFLLSSPQLDTHLR